MRTWTGILPRPDRSRTRGVLVFLLVLASLPARADTVSADIGATVAGLEWQLERRERCQGLVDTLQRRLDRLMVDPLINAAAITETQSRLDTNRSCVLGATTRASSLELSLAGLREQLLATTRADPAALSSRVEGLRTLERERATIDLDIRAVQLQISRLRLADPVNETLLAQKFAIRDGLRVSLASAVDRVAAANRELADFEAQALTLLADRRATLSWTTPVTRADGAPLAVGELGGYEIYMLAESTGETRVFTVSEPMTTSYTVDGLVPDTYHFSMSAFDIGGVFSPLSEIVSKTVR